MTFDFDDWTRVALSNCYPPRTASEIAEDAAWLVIERNGWIPCPQLLFALKEQILEQMAGG